MAARSGADRTVQMHGRMKVEGGGLWGCSPVCIIRSLLIRCFMLYFCLGVGHASKGPDFEGGALLQLRDALNDTSGRIADWSRDLVSPCYSWSFVTCRDGKVTALNLASMGFKGRLSPVITKLKFLATLELQDNELYGELPNYLGNMGQLETLNMSKNRFTGPIPANWDHLSHLKILDLSSNGIFGRIPAEFFTIPTFDFSRTGLACGKSLNQPCTSSSVLSASATKLKLRTIIASASSIAFIILLLVAIFACRYHVQKSKRDVFIDVAGEDDNKIPLSQLRRFSLREIQIATDNFCENNVIGQGGFGKVYRGVLWDKTKVAVKRLADNGKPAGESAFLMEASLISVAVHRNLLRLIGICTTPSERILVYPFMRNLSVAYRLRDLKLGEKGLDWLTRKRVAFGAAHGLEYLHEQCNPRIIHRDLKAANILLDDDFEPVLGDFGLAQLVDAKLTHVTTRVRGTMGHIAPEYLSTGKSTEKTDVFGYGITLLELVTGQRAIDFARLEEEEDVLLLDHIKKLLGENRLTDIVDPSLATYNPKEVEMMVQVALLCTQGSPKDRPTMGEVVKLLQGNGLEERWCEWEQQEEVRNQELQLLTRLWTEKSSSDQEAIELSRAR